MSDETTVSIVKPPESEWVIRLRFKASKQDAHEILDEVCRAASRHGGLVVLGRDE